VKIFSGPTTVKGSFIENATSIVLGRFYEMLKLSQETCLSASYYIDDGKVCSLFVMDKLQAFYFFL